MMLMKAMEARKKAEVSNWPLTVLMFLVFHSMVICKKSFVLHLPVVAVTWCVICTQRRARKRSNWQKFKYKKLLLKIRKVYFEDGLIGPQGSCSSAYLSGVFTGQRWKRMVSEGSFHPWWRCLSVTRHQELRSDFRALSISQKGNLFFSFFFPLFLCIWTVRS